MRLAFFFLFLLSSYPAFAQDYLQVPCAIQITSQVSDGKYSLEQIIKIAQEKGFQALIITDREIMRWEYGAWPARRLIKKSVEANSIFRYGVKQYLEDLFRLQKTNPGIILIPAFESAPFYYWEGNLLDNNLKLKDWHKHLIVMGLDKEEDYNRLPVIGNKKGLIQPFKIQDVCLFWPFIFLFIGLLFIFRWPLGSKDDYGRRIKPYSGIYRISGIILIIFSALALFNNYPFKSLKFDQYHGYQGVRPYQNFIDYVNQRGGLVFWAHPEVSNTQQTMNIEVSTEEYPEYLWYTRNYTGYAILYEGYKKIGKPGGIWDDILNEYCQGLRKKPVWIIGGLGFDADGELGKAMDDLRNILLLQSFNKDNALDALRQGRMYVVQGRRSAGFILDTFSIKDTSGEKEKVSGETLDLGGSGEIRIAGHFLDGQNQEFRIKLIRNGQIIKIISATSPFDIRYEIEDYKKGDKVYYRIELESKGLFLVSNPIFIL